MSALPNERQLEDVPLQNMTNFSGNDQNFESPSQRDVDTKIDGLNDTDGHEEEDEEEEWSDDDDDDDRRNNLCNTFIQSARSSLVDVLNKNSACLKRMLSALIGLGYFSYFGYCMSYSFGDEDSLTFLVITCCIALCVINQPIQRLCRSTHTDLHILESAFAKKWVRYLVHLVIIAGLGGYIGVVVAWKQPRNLQGLAGMAFFVLTAYICSRDPSKIKWRTVFWGLTLQILFGLLILKTSWGASAFRWLGNRVAEFLAHTDAGSRFVFGEQYKQHYFVFKVLPVITFFSMIVSMLFHLGVLQIFIIKGGTFLAFVLGTSATESVSAVANIFISMTEAPLLIQPFLDTLSDSELHCILAGGFATIAGGVMATFIMFQIPANHLISASVMSAPAALVMSKLLHPESRRRKPIDWKAIGSLSMGTSQNLLEAAANGAARTCKMIANIVVNLIAFMALLHFVNSTIDWLGQRGGYSGFSFQLICSYVFWPMAFMMGVESNDCFVMAELVGIKTFVNEFVAYVELSKFISNRRTFDEYLANATANVTVTPHNLTGTWMTLDTGDIYLNDTGVTLDRGLLSHRTVVIATYALCGFANFTSIGIQIGCLSALAPRRKSDLARLGVSSMMTGNIACFMTACVAGLLYNG